MFDADEDDPGPCPICGTAHTACTGGPDDPASVGVGVTRGVIVRVAAPPTPSPTTTATRAPPFAPPHEGPP